MCPGPNFSDSAIKRPARQTECERRIPMRRHGATLVAVFIFAGATLIASCAKPYHEEVERRNQRGPSENKNSYQRGPMSPHWNSPFALGLPRGAFDCTIGKFGPGHIPGWKPQYMPGWKNVERTGEVTSTSTASSLALSSGPDGSI